MINVEEVKEEVISQPPPPQPPVITNINDEQILTSAGMDNAVAALGANTES